MYGKRIKELRTEKEISQKELALILNTTQSTIGKYEREELQPNIETIIKICQIFNISSDYLIGIEDEIGTKINAPKYSIGTFNNNGGTVDLK